MSTDRNYWATYRDSIAFWEGNLPPPAKLGMERVFEFARHILDTAEREQVMRVLGVPAPPSAKNCDELSWFEFFRARFEREGRLNLFPGYPSIPERFGGGRLRLPARLAYYQGDRIIEEEVEDVGDLEKAVVMARGDDPHGIRSTLPIVLGGDAREEEEEAPGRPPTRALPLYVALYTDIWFPRVQGLRMGDLSGRADELHPARGRDRLMDNSALAARHTPRLNRFIETLRAAILELGGTWDKPDVNPTYKSMIHAAGILLDYPAADA
ncbi:MAG TPA: hypothetical protein VFA20_23600 [Myxococcaceae bacterium]|nr:hypothetical protein [Myxococcaceae bacterium]